MPLRNAKALTWRPRGLSDSLDGTNAFAGAMSSLMNLIPDPSTSQVFVPRPAAIQLTSFPTVVSAGQVTAGYVFGDIFYGMIGSGLVAGCDQPFAFNLDLQQLLPITGITPRNLPTSPSTVGDWQPPTMSALGNFIIVTHPGFNGGGNGFFGWLDITNPLAPVWNSGNLTLNPLVAPPVSAFNFNGRMYYAVGNATVASDEQLPLQSTDAGQVLIYGDRTPITALAALPLYNQLGGIAQALMVVKGSAIIYQLTGDFTGIPSPWSINTLNVATGTLAPNTLATTPIGLAFIAPDGLRFISFTGTVSDPVGNNGQGVTLPFINAVTPSRMAAAFNYNILRVTVLNGASNVNGFQEYWYDFNLKIWTGPHSFPVALIFAWKNTFIVANPIIAGV